MPKIRFLAAAVSLALVSLLVVRTSNAAFFDTTDNPGNEFSAGDVVLTDDDGGVTAMFTMPNMAPGSTGTRCINVTYEGTLDADVRLYGAATGSGLEDFLDLTVERSTGAAGGATFSCTGFVEAGKAAVWTNATDGDLGAFLSAATDFATGADTWAPAGATPVTVSYRFTVGLQNDGNASGLDATVGFTWEAQPR